ncbi:MAG: deoxyribose-phosphate aldolase [Bacteroidales bacterium]|nr:deoxyribose-phosphate aldolase [Bacteroidales bacterium]
MEQFFANFTRIFNVDQMNKLIHSINEKVDEASKDVAILKKIFSLIDLTSLNSDDSAISIKEFCKKVNHFQYKFPEMPSVAAVCVYPVFAPVLKSSLNNKNIALAVVSGGFPSSQTFTDVKVAETLKALTFGVNEIDIVISVGEFLDGNYQFILEEIKMIKDTIGSLGQLKVILETGLLKEDENIWKASLLAMEGGADFIKTSTGKVTVNATPEASYMMLNAIKSFYSETGKKVGFKVAGGISSSKSAVFYYYLVQELLGDEWLNKNLFRIGASSLANNILSDIKTIEQGIRSTVVYF